MKYASKYLKTMLLPALIYFLYGSLLFAQDIPVEDTIAIGIDLFNQEEPASITLAYNFKDYNRNSRSDKYTDAKLVYQLNDTIALEKEVRLKSRGNNRRETCSFPPIWINIKKAKLQNSNLEGVNRIKLVTHCANSRANMNYVLKEYLVYKMYNIISPYSFRVRLVRMKYVDTGRDDKSFEAWGFLIEPEEIMAKRLDSYPLQMDHIGYNLTDRDQTDVMSLFQYMVGNADFSITGRHNIKLLKLADPKRPGPIPVPYDFDYTGFVDASYAVPGEGLPIESVKDRYFLGPCRPEARFTELIEYFQSRKQEIYSLIGSFEYLDERNRDIVLDYLDRFFMPAGQKNYVQKYLIPTCRDTIAN